MDVILHKGGGENGDSEHKKTESESDRVLAGVQQRVGFAVDKFSFFYSWKNANINFFVLQIIV